MRAAKLVVPFLFLFAFASDGVQANPTLRGSRDLAKFLSRPLMRVMVERQVADDFMMAYFGRHQVPFFRTDFMKVLGDHQAISAAEQRALETALARSEFRLREILRGGRRLSSAEQLALVRRVMRSDFYPTYDDVFINYTAQMDFVGAAGAGTRASARDLFRVWGTEIDYIKQQILRGRSLARLDAPGANFRLITEQVYQLRPLNFTEANIPFSHSSANVLFRGATLDRANMNWAIMESTSFNNARLRHTQAVGTDFRGSEFLGADISYANMRLADLRGVNLEFLRSYRGVQLEGALFDEATRLPFSHAEAVQQHKMVFASDFYVNSFVP